MQDYDLINPGIDQVSQTLRKTAAHAISNLEGVTDSGAVPDSSLGAFFFDAATKTPGFVPPSTGDDTAVVTDAQAFSLHDGSGKDTGAKAAASVTEGAVKGLNLLANSAAVVAGNVVTVKNWAGNMPRPGTVAVTGGAISGVALPATSAIVDHAGNVSVRNPGGTRITEAASAVVSAGSLASVTLPATVIGVASGAKLSLGTVTGSGNFATFTVAGGVITGVVLSAS